VDADDYAQDGFDPTYWIDAGVDSWWD